MTTTPDLGGLVRISKAAQDLGPDGPSQRTLARHAGPDPATSGIVRVGACYFMKGFLYQALRLRPSLPELVRFLHLFGVDLTALAACIDEHLRGRS